MATLTDMVSKLVSANAASSSGSGPKTPSPSKQGTKVTKDQVQTPGSQNTAPIQPLVIQSESQALVFEPVVAPEADAFLGLEDDPDSPKINPFYYDPKGDILLLEAI
nr:hypothetical protein [Tanacetum cinerariifolium]